LPSSVNQKLTLAHQQTSNDYEKLKQEEADKSTRLQELMYVNSPKNNKLANDLINARLATPKKAKKSPKSFNDERRIEHICDYYDELQYNYDYFYNKAQTPENHDNKSSKNLYQYSQLTKLRKNILNRKLIDHRQRLKSEKLKENSEKSLIASISSVVESMTIPSLHFHLILSLTMVLLTHQCPQYLLVL
jgi:kinesin family protein 5